MNENGFWGALERCDPDEDRDPDEPDEPWSPFDADGNIRNDLAEEGWHQVGYISEDGIA